MDDPHLNRRELGVRLVTYVATPVAAVVAAFYLGRNDIIALLLVAFAVAFALMVSAEKATSYLAPSNLPPPPTHVVGRESQLDEIRSHLASDDHGRRLVVVHGMSGIGKTTLSLFAAHRAAPWFQAGELFARLDPDVSPRQAVRTVRSSFIGALGHRGDVEPRTPWGQAVRYRSLMRGLDADRRLLIVLDDVRDPAQIRRLLTSSRWTAVIVTSKNPLDILDATLRVKLDALSESAAVRMLGAIIGSDRVKEEHAAAEQLVAAAQFHPLAIRLVGMALANRPHIRLSVALKRMVSEPSPTSAAGTFDSTLDLSYSMLTRVEQDAVVALGLVDRRRFAAWELAVLLANSEREAWGLCDRLTDAGLLERRSDDATGIQYFQLLEHVELYARGRAGRRWPQSEREACVQRLRDERRRRQDAERATEEGFEQLYVKYESGNISRVFKDARDRVSLARDRDDDSAEADATAMLAELQAELGGHEDVLDLIDAPLRTGSDSARAKALRLRAKLRGRARQIELARADLHDAFGLTRSHDATERMRIVREQIAIESLGSTPEHGAALLERFYDDLNHRTDRPDATAYVHGRLLVALDRLDHAEEVLSAGADIAHDRGRRLWSAWIAHQRAVVALAVDRPDAALDFARQGVDLFGSMRHRYGIAHCRMVMADATVARDDVRAAMLLYENALETFRYCGDAWIEAVATERLATVRAPTDRRVAIDLLADADRLFGSIVAFADQARVQDERAGLIGAAVSGG